MTKTYPSQGKSFMLVCEDIREEKGGKLTLTGLYSGTLLIEPKEGDAVMLPSIAFLIRFSDGAGEFDTQVAVKLPGAGAEAELRGEEVQKLTKKPDESLSLILKLVPFKAVVGEYCVQVTLDRIQSLEFMFEVKRGKRESEFLTSR